MPVRRKNVLKTKTQHVQAKWKPVRRKNVLKAKSPPRIGTGITRVYAPRAAR